MSIKMYFVAIVALSTIVLAGNLHAMPSYDDVLLVVNSQSKASLEIGNYFKNARKIPDINVVTVSMKDRQGGGSEAGSATVTEKQAMLATIKNHMIKNKLTEKINYIVLTRGIPVYANSEEVMIRGYQPGPPETFNPVPTVFHLTDIFLLYNLSESAKDNSIPDIFAYNKYFYYYNEDILGKKFSSKKFGYYIVARLDGPGVNHIKTMIDDTGFPAYTAWTKTNGKAKFLTLHYPVSALVKNEVRKRNIQIVQVPEVQNLTKNWLQMTATMDTVAKDVMFAYFNNVDFGYDAVPTDNNFYGDGDMVGEYPFIYRGATFLPGSFATCFRSFPARQMARENGGLLKINLAGNLLTDYQKSYDGSDMKFRHQTCVAYDPVNNQVWCGTGEPSLNVGGSFNEARGTDEFYREHMRNEGGGIAIYDAANGNILNWINANDPGSPLKNNRVVKIAYDKTGNRIWVAHYKGIQYYDLAAKKWCDVPELQNDFAAACSIYVDPYDTDKVYFSFYYNGSGDKVSSLMAGAKYSIFEYSKSAKTVTVHEIEKSDSTIYGRAPQIAKTDATTLWVTRGSAYTVNPSKVVTSQFALIKYDLATKTTLEKIYLTDSLPEVAAPPADLNALTVFAPRALVAGQNGQVVISIASGIKYKRKDDKGMNIYPCEIRNYIMRIQSQTGKASTVSVFNNAMLNLTHGSVPRYEVRSLISADPKKCDELYAALSWPYIGSFNVLKSTDGGKGWTKLTTSSKAVAVYDLALDNKQTLYAVRGYQTAQNLLSDFMAFGLGCFGGGMVHDTMKYSNAYIWIVPDGWSDPYIRKATDIYTASQASTDNISGAPYSQTEPMMFMYADGFYMGEVRFATQRTYPQQGGGGYVGHMLVFEPKCAPFAPRVDEENLKGMIVNGKIEIPLRSPGLIFTEDGFIPETINSGTVKVYDYVSDKAFTPESIVYDVTGRKIVISGNFTEAIYSVTLTCGINGIKNIKGASLTNTRKNEWQDAITCFFGKNFEINSQDDIYQPPADSAGGKMPNTNSKVDLTVTKVTLGAAPVAGKPLLIKFEIKNVGTAMSKSGGQTATVYFNGLKDGSVSYSDLQPGAVKALTYTVDGSKIVAGLLSKVLVKADAGAKVEEMRESNNTNFVTFLIDIRPDLTVKEITLSPKPKAKAPLTIYFKISNIGASATASGAGVQVATVFVDGKPVGTVVYDDVPKGGLIAKQLLLPLGIAAAGTHKIKVTADTNKAVDEINENNNVLEKSFPIAK
jgi:uncharacterized protein (TIGR03790 family)